LKLGILTSGGDCPGLNAAIRAVVKTAVERFHYECVGIKNGWEGLSTGDILPLPTRSVSGILPRGGTILGTARFNPMKDKETTARVLENIALHCIDAIIVIGGDGTLSAAHEMAKIGVKVVGVPKTIDNDIAATDATFGYFTAVQTVTNAIDNLHATAESHHRVMVIETMGRKNGWIAVQAGIAGGADMILIPEKPFNWDTLTSQLKHRHQSKKFSIIVVAEGAIPEGGQMVDIGEFDSFGRPRLGGIGFVVANKIEDMTGIETRVTILGHVQRGGTPVAQDRLLATRFGVGAVEAASEGKWDHFIALQGNQFIPVPIELGIGQPKMVDDRTYMIAETFFG
jgi:phosphofructokinase-like protein